MRVKKFWRKKKFFKKYTKNGTFQAHFKQRTKPPEKWY